MVSTHKTLRELRDERHLTQFQVAAQVGVSLSMISGIEARRNQPSVGLALKLAAFLGVPVEAINWPTDAEVRENSSRTKKQVA